MRLGFADTSPLHVSLVLSGLTVLAEADSTPDSAVAAELAAAGVPSSTVDGMVKFDVADIDKLAAAGSHVTFTADEALSPLLEMATCPSDGNAAVNITMASPTTVTATWSHQGETHVRTVPDETIAALLCADIHFVATPDAFTYMAAACPLPLLAGRVATNLDGFIEIATSKPQLVESSPVPGLFRLGAGRFGVPTPYAQRLDSLPGFQWVTPRPTQEAAPDVASGMPIPLSAHAEADLSELVTNLATWRAQAVVWRSGLGRRVFAAAALHVLDAWPALVVCRPEDTWTWTRHAQLMGRTSGVADPGADMQLLTYTQLAAAGGWPRAVQSIVFDSPGSWVGNPTVAAAARRLGSLSDAYRMVVAPTWPESDTERMSLMSLLRPAEFSPDTRVPVRYPPDSQTRFNEHVGAYLSRRDVAGGDTVDWFRRSKVLSLPATPAQSDAFDKTLGRLGADPAVTLMTLMELTSAGPEYATSPKIAAAVGEVQEALSAGERVVVVTRFSRTAHLVHALLRGRGVDLVGGLDEWAAPRTPRRAVIARFSRAWADLSDFDRVVIVDWPWSTRTIDDAVGTAAGLHGPALVEVLHTPGSIDDDVVELAVRRGTAGQTSETLDPAEVARLLGRAGAGGAHRGHTL